MMKLNDNFYNQAIYSVAHDIRHIGLPAVRGTNSRVYIVSDSGGGKTVYRFNSRQTARRTHDISCVLHSHDIAVPCTTLHQYRGEYFETYPYILGKTMHEFLLVDPPSNGQILDIYADIAYQMRRLASIPVSDFDGIENKACHSVARANILQNTNCPFLANIVKLGTQVLNMGNKVICHCDLTPQNVLLDDNKKLSALLDMNAVSIGNMNFSIAIAGQGLYKHNLNPRVFYDVCHDIMPEYVNKAHIAVAQTICKKYYQIYGGKTR